MSIDFRSAGGPYVESEEVAPGLILDFDADGRVIGVELLYVSDLLASGSLASSEDAAA